MRDEMVVVGSCVDVLSTKVRNDTAWDMHTNDTFLYRSMVIGSLALEWRTTWPL